MLVELHIRDYAVVEELTLSLGSGLNVLSGETGAGKSIIVGALSLLLGERATADVVRSGAARASVEAVFDVSRAAGSLAARLDELGYAAEDGLLILRREVAAEGRNRAWVNGAPATAGVVGELGAALVDLHGQHEHQTLLRPDAQRAILDAYAGAAALADDVLRRHAELRRLDAELDAREERRRELESRADFLRFQLREIEAARLHPGEDAALETEARRRAHSEELLSGAAGVHEALYAADASVSARLDECRAALRRLVRFDPSIEESAALLDEALHLVEEAGARLGDYASAVEHDPTRLEQVRHRLDLIFRLKRKYGPELADVLATAQRVRGELAELDGADHDLGALRARSEEAGRELARAAAELSEARRAAAARLNEAVSAALPELGMTGGRFVVAFRPLDAVGPGGAEAVDFLITVNPGFEPRPLGRVASGGELSRVMLALTSVLAGADAVPTLVFDEVDAGVGGAVAVALARKLADVARDHQVFVVTHLPQLASRAHAHFVVEKHERGGTVRAGVRRLEGEARVEEIARMLGGDPHSATSREHARELLRTA